MYAKGVGVPKDYAAAREWYQRAINTGGGTMIARARLAKLYDLGLGGHISRWCIRRGREQRKTLRQIEHRPRRTEN
jgi:TPR repeat protein